MTHFSRATGAATARLIALYATSFGMLGVYMPFWPVWLAAHGLSPRQIAWTLAAGIFVRIASPWLAQRVDESGRPRRAAVTLAGVCVVVFASNHLVAGVGAWSGLHVLFAAAFMLILPLTDSIAVDVAREHYGRLRLFGSLSFLVAVASAGHAVESFGTHAIYVLVLGSLLATLAAATLLPDVARAHDGSPAASPIAIAISTGESTPPARPIARLLATPGFLAFVGGCGTVQASHAAMYGFGALHWRAVGIGEATIGVLWAVGIVAEVLLFACGASVARRLRPSRLAMCGAAAGVVRWAMLAGTDDVAWLVGAQSLHALSFGATHLALVIYVRESLPRRLAVTAQSIYVALGTGLGMGIATVVAGELYVAHPTSMFALMSAIAAIGGVQIACAARRQSDSSGSLRSR